MEEKISVIVPIYKVEQYLDRCVSSIRNQVYRNLEIILVDDGSPDNCGRMCDGYAELDPRIRVIHKPNGGLSDARNAGLEIATGEYFGFVDSDDFIHPEMYDDLYRRIREHGADIAQCSFLTTSSDDFTDPGRGENEKVIGNLEALRELYTPFKVDYVVAWNKLYRKKQFDAVRFPVGRIHEDEATTYRLFYAADRVVVTERKYYYYYQSPASIIRSGYSGRKLQYADAMEERIQFLKEKGLDGIHALAVKSYAQWLLLFLYRNRKALRKLPADRQGVLTRYRRVQELADADPGVSERFRTALRRAYKVPVLAGFLIYQRDFRNSLPGRAAGWFGFD